MHCAEINFIWCHEHKFSSDLSMIKEKSVLKQYFPNFLQKSFFSVSVGCTEKPVTKEYLAARRL